MKQEERNRKKFDYNADRLLSFGFKLEFGNRPIKERRRVAQIDPIRMKNIIPGIADFLQEETRKTVTQWSTKGEPWRVPVRRIWYNRGIKRFYVRKYVNFFDRGMRFSVSLEDLNFLRIILLEDITYSQTSLKKMVWKVDLLLKKYKSDIYPKGTLLRFVRGKKGIGALIADLTEKYVFPHHIAVILHNIKRRVLFCEVLRTALGPDFVEETLRMEKVIFSSLDNRHGYPPEVNGVFKESNVRIVPKKHFFMRPQKPYIVFELLLK